MVRPIFVSRKALQKWEYSCGATNTCAGKDHMYNCMHMVTVTKRLTILVDADMHRTLLRKVGRGNIGRFLVDAAKPLLASDTKLRTAYAEMAADSTREKEAQEWSEGVISDTYGS